jgi:hypothetical protein
LKNLTNIFSLLFLALLSGKMAIGQPVQGSIMVNFFGDTVTLPATTHLPEINSTTLSDNDIQAFYTSAESAGITQLITALTQYKNQHNLNDWFYYQLIRKTANTLSPKADNYIRYTLVKWLLLGKSGYDAQVRVISNNRLLFYVRSSDNVYNIPTQIVEGKQYVCLNYHDYKAIDLGAEKEFNNNIHIPAAAGSFSYKLTQMPDFKVADYVAKDLKFTYYNQDYSFKVMMNPVVKDIFINYPVVDFEAYFNIPLSKETYGTLIPGLKEAMKKMNQKQGIDYLMHFTRYAFVFERDTDHFGKEKRLLPEETLLYENSDCEDRAGLFFYLVKEMYNLPMITLLYPDHVTIAIQLDKPLGKTIQYKGRQYSVCEPTPQSNDLKMGQLPLALRNAAFEVGYEYIPGNK